MVSCALKGHAHQHCGDKGLALTWGFSAGALELTVSVMCVQEEAKDAFKELLVAVQVGSDWSWDKTMRAIISDPRWVPCFALPGNTFSNPRVPCALSLCCSGRHACLPDGDGDIFSWIC